MQKAKTQIQKNTIDYLNADNINLKKEFLFLLKHLGLEILIRELDKAYLYTFENNVGDKFSFTLPKK